MTSTHHSPALRGAIALGVLAAAGTALTACAASETTSAEDALRVGIDLTYAPYAYFEGETPAGFEVDATTAIAEELGIEVTYQDTRFEQLIPGLNADQFDLIASALYITPERAEQVDFIPTFATGNSIVVAEGATPLATADDLCGLVVGVIKGGDIANSLRDDASADCAAAGAGAIDVREFPTDPEATQALLSGQLDAQVTDAGVASTLNENGTVAVQITSTELLYPIQVGMAVRKGDTETVERIRDAIAALQDNGVWADLLAEYNLSEPDEDAVAGILG